jgi:hypothetical protein
VSPQEILALSAAQLAVAIREKRVTCVAAMEAALARMKAVHLRLNCLVRSDDENALAAAHLADKDLARGALRGSLHGVPMAHKDMYYRKGVVSSCGSKIGGNGWPSGVNDERNRGTEGRSEQDVPRVPPMHGILNERERTERFERFKRSNRR